MSINPTRSTTGLLSNSCIVYSHPCCRLLSCKHHLRNIVVREPHTRQALQYHTMAVVAYGIFSGKIMLADVCVLTVKLLSSILVYSIIGISHKALLPIDSFMYTTAQRPALLSRDIITVMGSNLLHRAACIIHIHILLLGSNRHCRPWSPPTYIHNTTIHIVHQIVLLYAMLRPTGQPPVKPHIIVCRISHHVSSRHLKIYVKCACAPFLLWQAAKPVTTFNTQHSTLPPATIQHSTLNIQHS